MTKYHIKAYFMHEHEQDAAKEAVTASVIKNAEWTAGYVMGVVDKAAIKSLSKERARDFTCRGDRLAC